MWISEQEAVEMYARFLAARHGTAASKLARKKASSLQLSGDLEGHRIWNDVADTIERRPKHTSTPLHRPENVTAAS